MVGETGFAPARASAHEFLRLACIRSTTHRKSWCGRGDLHAHAPGGAAVFKTARSTVPRTAANGRGGRSRTGTGNHAQRVLSPPCLRSNHAALKWCGQRESHPHELAPTGFSLRRVYCFATSAEKLDPARRFALRSSRYQRDASLPTLCRQKNGRSGRTRTFVVWRDNAFTARRNCCSATLRNWGLERDSHPRPSPYEGAALPAAPSSQLVGRPGNAPSSAG